MGKKWYLSLRSIPELSSLSKKDRSKIWRRNSIKGFLHWQTWAAFILFITWSVFIFFITDYIGDELYTINRNIIIAFNSIIGIGVGLLVFMIVWLNMTRPYMIKGKQGGEQVHS